MFVAASNGPHSFTGMKPTICTTAPVWDSASRTSRLRQGAGRMPHRDPLKDHATLLNDPGAYLRRFRLALSSATQDPLLPFPGRDAMHAAMP